MKVVETFARAPDAVDRVWNLLCFFRTRNPGKPLVAVFDIDDTLVMDVEDEAFHVNPAVVKLFQSLKSLGCENYVVTARQHGTEERKFSLDQLRAVGIDCRPGHLFHCPARDRSRGTQGVAEFKARARQRIAEKHGTKLALTVGDQWTDMVVVKSSDELYRMPERTSVAPDQFALVRPEDNVVRWGLKLREA